MPLDPQAHALAFTLAQPIDDPAPRQAFLQEVEQRLGDSPMSGPGAAWRIGAELQRRYVDPPNLHGGQTGRAGLAQSDYLCARRLVAHEASDVVGPTLQRATPLDEVHGAIVDTADSALMTDMAQNYFDNVWLDVESLVQSGRQAAAKIMMAPVRDAETRSVEAVIEYIFCAAPPSEAYLRRPKNEPAVDVAGLAMLGFEDR
jgi:hypothetical protein